jgi:flagellar hook-basal body complex protein FliE
MSNLAIENLSNVVQTGDVETFMGQSSAVSEARARQVMQTEGLGPSNVEGGKTFSDLLRQSVDQANTMQHQADLAIKELVAGRSKNVHETMLAIERADSSLKLMMQVRNKVLDAYREIMRMQV